MAANDDRGRRTFLKSSALLVGAAGMAGTAGLAQAQDDVVETFELEGNTPGWVGVSPAEIEGETNPTLEFGEVGGRYRVRWENGDGDPHNLAIRDADGENLVETEFLTSAGETAEVEFEATTDMITYLCEPHPGRMRGDVVVGDPTPLELLTRQADVALEATADGWVGGAPDVIAGEENPTLEFEAGEEYVVGFVNADGGAHSLAILDADGTVLESTDTSEEEDEIVTLEFTASGEVASYVCETHDEMAGDVLVEGDEEEADDERASDDDEADGAGEPEEDDDEAQEQETAAEADDDDDDDGTPGFGVLTALAGVGGAGAVAANRLRGGDEADD